MNRYKYIHIFTMNDTKFNPRILDMVSDNKNIFEIEQHLFVTPYEKVFHVFKEMKKGDSKLNIELYKTKKNGGIQMINYYAPYATWIFVHCMFPITRAIFIKRTYCKKIIWRTWGHDVSFSYQNDKYIKNFLKHLFEAYWKTKVKSFRGIGIANIVDLINIKEIYGNVETFYMPYPIRETDYIAELARKEKNNSEILNIMIGHSGHDEEHHIEILRDLTHIKNEQVHIFLVLSYGESDYICDVEKFAIENWGNKVTIVKKMLPYIEYVNLLNKMDIAILDSCRSYALGNISILLELKKKIFLNRNGLLKRAFEIEKIPFGYTDMLKKISYEELRKPLDYSQCDHTDLHKKSYEEQIKEWNFLLNSLDDDAIKK